MKKLVLYSDQVPDKSQKVDEALLQMINKTNPKVAYIPSRGDLTRKYYNQKKAYYHNLGIDNLIYFDIDVEYDPSKVTELLQCDAIHLSGGDTVYFLNTLLKRDFQDVLRAYAQNGGILIGISAGSILMSNCIDIVPVLHDGMIEVANTKALCLNDFEFVPHWERNHIYYHDIKQYSKLNKRTIYLCSDSDGIVVNNDEVRLIGNVIKITNGVVAE